MKNLMPWFVMLGCLITIGVAIVTITNYSLKRKIIEKGPLDENTVKILDKLSGLGSEMLKWGIILLFGGIGLVLLEYIPYSGQSPILLMATI